MNKQFWRAALNRAIRTVAQTLVGSIPAGAIVTVEMVKGLNINALWAVLSWLGTGLLAGAASILTSIGWGIPEAESKENVAVDDRRYGGEQTDEEAECPVTVLAYDDYDEDGSPIVGHDFPDEGGYDSCDKCDLSAYVDGGEDDAGDA